MKLSSGDVLLFSGDSITDGNRGHSMDLNHIFGHGYQYIIASRLALDNCGAQPRFVNKGYSGYTIPRLLETWQEDVIANRPSILSVLVGVNDAALAAMNKTDPVAAADEYEENYKKLITITKQEIPGIKIIICEPFYFPLERNGSFEKSPHPCCERMITRPDGGDTDDFCQRKLDCLSLMRERARRVASQFNLTFVGLYDKFLEYSQKCEIEYLTWDGTHPTIAGHALIADEWLAACENE